jgi:ParB family chromosome partitioning protein
MVYAGQLTAGHARAVLSVQEEASRMSLASKIVSEGLSVREAENLARLMAAGQAPRASKPPTPKAFKVVARSLRRLLGTNVRVRQIKDKGKIEIEFRTEEELERIYRALTEHGAGSEGPSA